MHVTRHVCVDVRIVLICYVNVAHYVVTCMYAYTISGNALHVIPFLSNTFTRWLNIQKRQDRTTLQSNNNKVYRLKIYTHVITTCNFRSNAPRMMLWLRLQGHSVRRRYHVVRQHYTVKRLLATHGWYHRHTPYICTHVTSCFVCVNVRICIRPFTGKVTRYILRTLRLCLSYFPVT